MLQRLVLVCALASALCAAAAAPGGGEALAVVNGASIYAGDLKIDGELIALERQAYELRKQALDAAIADRLLRSEAARRGVSLQALLDAEVNFHVDDASDAEVEAFYEQQRTRIRQPLDEVRSQIADLLKDGRYRAVRQAYVQKLRAAADVKIALDPPRLPVDLSRAPKRGPENAPVTIVEFSDFQCSFCRRVQPTLAALQRRYGGKLRWSFKDLPLVSIHPAARKAAEAARCAGEQGKFWQYREALFQNTKISDDLHDLLSAKLELDRQVFQSCLDSGKFKPLVDADTAEAQAFGISGTPAFMINGILVSGAQPLDVFTALIDRELELASATGR